MICVLKSSLKIAWKTKFFFENPKNLIASAFCFAEGDTEKHRYASAKDSNAVLVKLTEWIIKNDHVINCAMFFCKWFEHDQASNVIWLHSIAFNLSAGGCKWKSLYSPQSLLVY